MTYDYLVPDVGEGIAEIEVLQWYAEVGDRVEADAVLVEAETDKSVVEIPAPVSGLLLRRAVAEGSRAAVGDLLAVIGPDDAAEFMTPPTSSTPEPSPGAGAPSGPAPQPDPPRSTPPGPAAPVTSPGSKNPASIRPLASPHTRRLAAQRGIDLAAVTGTGPHGRILESDLDTPLAPLPGSKNPAIGNPPDVNPPSATPAPAAASPAPRPRTGTVTPLTGVRRATAEAMAQALTIPHITEFREIDARKLLKARRALKDRTAQMDRTAQVSVFTLLVAAVARALTDHPSFNATFDGQSVTTYSAVDLGIATATDDGLLVPVLRDADRRNLTGLAAELARLTAGARTRTLARGELTDGTFTVTNFGSFGTWLGQPIIRPPEVAIAGFGRITDRVVAADGKAKIRPMLPIVIAADHRIHDGIHVAALIDTIAEIVAEPLNLLV